MRGASCTRRVAMLVIGVLVALPVAAQEETTIAKSGSTSVKTIVGRKTITITIETIRLDSSSSVFPKIEWGTNGVTIVHDMEIAVDGNSLAVPPSSFADLLDPRVLSVKSAKGGFVLTIVGADGAETYLVRVHFDASRVKRRTVYSLLDGEHVVEDTRYFKAKDL